MQEAESKWPAFQQQFDGVKLHLIGPLQSNKARSAMELFDVIHTLDRPKLAQTFARLAQEMGRCPDMFVQVNTGEEDQKAGVLPADADDFIKECLSLDLPVRGLMCIPPVDEEAALHFALLAKIAARNGVGDLSMGMSSDFEKAIALGATHVRVGSAIFGERTRRLARRSTCYGGSAVPAIWCRCAREKATQPSVGYPGRRCWWIKIADPRPARHWASSNRSGSPDHKAGSARRSASWLCG